MKVIACLLVLCLAMSAFAQVPAGMGAAAAARQRPAALAALLGRGGRGGNPMLTYGALSGAMGDTMTEFMMCQMIGLPRMICMTRLMQ